MIAGSISGGEIYNVFLRASRSSQLGGTHTNEIKQNSPVVYVVLDSGNKNNAYILHNFIALNKQFTI